MVAAHGLVDHGDGVVGVADGALAAVVHRELLAAQDVAAGAGAVGLEVSGRAEVGPAHVGALAQLVEGLGHGVCQRLVCIGEVGAVGEAGGVLGVGVEAAGTADYEQAGLSAARDVVGVGE